jgi:hypothetical protein
MTCIRPSGYQTALTLLILLIPSSLHAWAREGHEIIAAIAEQRLEPTVREIAIVLLERTTFVEAASWADTIRNQQNAPWHYVNMQITDNEYDAARVCPKDQCLIGQIERFRKVLADQGAEFKKRQKALKYLIHFVGDLHQPLHAGDNHDRGGNDVQVEFLGQTINPYNHKPWNLHAVWDSGILEEHDRDVQHYVERLNAWLESKPEDVFQEGSVVDWGMESHQLAKDNVYVLPADRKLGEEYYRASVPIVDQQLAKAGVRLAKLLNDILRKR